MTSLNPEQKYLSLRERKLLRMMDDLEERTDGRIPAWIVFAFARIRGIVSRGSRGSATLKSMLMSLERKELLSFDGSSWRMRR